MTFCKGFQSPTSMGLFVMLIALAVGNSKSHKPPSRVLETVILLTRSKPSVNFTGPSSGRSVQSISLISFRESNSKVDRVVRP